MSRRIPPSADLRQDVAAPLHHQVYSVLRQQIIEGQYPLGHPMPSEHKLETLFSVSRITVRRALDRLVSEGLVVKRHGKGNYPQPVITPPPIRTNLRGMLENLVAMGRKTGVEIIEFGYINAPSEVSTLLELPAGDVVQRVIRVRSFEKTPFSFLTTWVPERIGRTYTAKDLQEHPLLSLLEQGGTQITDAEQTISAKLADTRTAPRLGVELGAPLLAIRRVVRDQNGAPIELLEALYRPDIYEYRMKMARKGNKQEFVWADDTVVSR